MPTALLAAGPASPELLDTVRAVRLALPGWDVTLPDPCAPGARGRAASASATIRAVRAADALVLVGGTVFTGSGDGARGVVPRWDTRASTASLLAVALLAAALGRPVALVSVGAEPVSGSRGRRTVRALARCCDLLVLRDTASVHALAACGVPMPARVGADLVWTLLPGSPAPAAPLPEASVVVSVLHGDAGPEAVAAGLARALAARGESEVTVSVEAALPGAEHGRLADAVVHALAAHGVPATRTEGPATEGAAVGRYARAGLVLAMRRTTLVEAHRAGRPVVVLGNDPDLVALGHALGRPVVHGAALAGGDAVADAVVDALTAAPPVPGVAAAQRESAQDVAELLRLLLERGDTPGGSLSRATHLQSPVVAAVVPLAPGEQEVPR